MCSSDLRADLLARGTPGFSGADLANLVNEAALFAARRSARVVENIDFERAKDKIMMGAERRSIVMPEEERRNTAYHESGHAIVARMLPKTDPVHKVTIIPRGRALGVTMQLPEQDRYSMDRDRMLNTISVLFGGRIAEEVFMHQMTTGASNDFERATSIARDMVTRYGMSDVLGPMVYAENEGEIFLGRSITRTVNMSEETMRKVDNEIRKIIDEQYAIARHAATERRKANPQRHPGQRARRDQCQPRHHRRDERGRHRPNPHDQFGVLVEPAADQKADPAPDLARQETEQQQCEIGLHRHDAALRMRCTRCAP